MIAISACAESSSVYFFRNAPNEQWPDVAQFHVFDIVWNRAERGGLRNGFGRRDEDEFGSFVNEPGDVPGTGDAVDLRALRG